MSTRPSAEKIEGIDLLLFVVNVKVENMLKTIKPYSDITAQLVNRDLY
jgi:hypothetical protein